MAKVKDNSLDLWRNEKGDIQYNNKCSHCTNCCKQSCKVKLVSCLKYKGR